MYDRNSESENIVTSLFNERGRHRLVAFATAVCMIFSALTALFVASPSADAVADDPVQIKIGTILEPDDFNPFTMTTGISYTIAWFMYEMMYWTGPEREPIPQLAKEHYVSADGKVWTYNLTEDSYFHDGHQVNAHDVAFTHNMIMDNEKECALLGGYLKGIISTVALDDFTVQITLEYPKATMLSGIAPVLPEHLWSDVVEAGKIKTVDLWDTKYFPDGPVGSGAIVLKEYDKAMGFIKLAKNDQYHLLDLGDSEFPEIADTINVDEIMFVIYKNEGTMVTALKTGLIDVIDGVPEAMWYNLLDTPGIEGQKSGSLDLTEVGFNCASQELRDSVDEDGHANFPKAATCIDTYNLSVRQAITMATNRTLIVEDILQGLGEEADSFIPTATPFWHWYVPEEEKWPFDIEAANDLLDRSGYNQFDDDGVRMNETSGARLEWDFHYIGATMRDELSAGKITDWCKELGIKLTPVSVAEGTLYNYWFNLQYDMFIWNWQPDVDPAFLLSVLTTDEIPTDYNDITAWSDCYYSNPVYDQLYEAQLTAMDPYERQTIVHEMQRIAYRDCPYIMLWYPCSLIAYRTDKFMDFPDIEQFGGATPDTIWFYFSVKPYVEGANEAPYDVDAGDDVNVYVGEEQTFSGTAKDLESPQDDLTWTWTIDEFGETTTLYEQTIQYTFDVVGTFEVTLSVEDPEGLSSSDSLTATVVEVPEELGWVVGRVQDNSTAETAGDPIEGVLVSVEGMVDGSLLYLYEYTDEQGLYNISVVPGTYVVNASAEGYSNGTASVTVEVNETIWQNFTLKLTSGSVAGLVLDSETEEPVAGALVQLYEPGEENASYAKKTDDNGSFEILLVDTGVYKAVVSKDGYETNETNVTVTPGEDASLDIYLTAAEEEEDWGLSSTTAIAAIAALAIIAAVAAVALLLKRKKGSEPASPEDESPPEQTAEPPEPPGT